MSKNIVVISPGHVGKPGVYDTGAEKFLVEREGVMKYGMWMWSIFEKNGWWGYFTAHDYYSRRQMFANSVGANLFLAPHLNAGGGRYSLILYDHRSKRGKEIAEHVAQELLSNKWEFEIRVQSIGYNDRGFNIIDKTRMPAFILEPLFVDNSDHYEYIQTYGYMHLGVLWAEAFAKAYEEVMS